MNKQERIKARALCQVKMSSPGDRNFARGMSLLAARDPETVLKPRQKWLLDLVVYRYRRQLYENPAVEVPEALPQLENYQPKQRQRRQMDLF